MVVEAIRPIKTWELVLTLAVVLLLYLTRTPDWAGWLLIYLSFLIVSLDRYIHNDRNLLVFLWLILLVRHGAALINANLMVLPGAELDAATFHAYAVDKAYRPEGLALTIGSSFYINFLAFFYMLGGKSHLFGQELSVLAYVLSSLVLIRLLDLLSMNRHRMWLLLLYGLLPSSVIFGSVTLRESFEVLFFMLGVYAGLRVFMRPAKWAAPVSITAFFAMGLFHQVLLFYALFAIVVTLVAPLLQIDGKKGRRLFTAGIVVAVGAVGVFTVPSIPTSPGDDYFAKSKEDVIASLIRYREDIAKGKPRTAYEVDLDGTSYGRLVATTAVLYLHYLFAPFPWQITDTKDAYAAFESMLRLTLLVASFFVVVHALGAHRLALVILLVLFASMTFLWSLGTTNYGQGIRHHMLTNWILIVAGGHGLVVWLQRVLAARGTSVSQTGRR